MLRWAFLGVVPHMGGTFTVFLALKEGLAAHGIELRWVAAGSHYAEKNLMMIEHASSGEVVASSETNEKAAAIILQQHLEDNYEELIVNVLCDRLCTNLVRYMGSDLHRVMLVHNITMGTYAAAASIRDHVHGTIGVSHRIASDLIKKHGFKSVNTCAIPNSIPVKRFQIKRVAETVELRILVLSRIEHRSKGCFRVPRILELLKEKQVPYTCTVAGDGEDLDEMKARCKGMAVSFLGRIPASDVPELVSTHDVYLFPSTYEGFGLSLVEAMAGGCVPISSSLKGVTDQIVEDGKSGFLVASDDISAYAESLKELHMDRGRLNEMRVHASARASSMYSIEAVSSQVLNKVTELRSLKGNNLASPKKISRWTYPRGLRSGLRTFLPEALKDFIRQILEQRASGK